MAEITDIRPFRLRAGGATQRHRGVIPRERMPKVACAFCGSNDTEPTSIYGCHMMTAQYLCHGCRSTFDWVREEWDVEG